MKGVSGIKQKMYAVNERFYLREFSIDDWQDVHNYASQVIVSQFQAWGPNTTEESLAFVKEAIEDASQLPRIRYAFAVVINESVIGAGELFIRDQINRIGEIGYVIHPAYWGQGIATELSSLLINYGFDVLELHRIIATCDPRNFASVKVLEKIGMVIEGRMREHILLDDYWRDSLLFSILDKEWPRI